MFQLTEIHRTEITIVIHKWVKIDRDDITFPRNWNFNSVRIETLNTVQYYVISELHRTRRNL